MFQVVAHRGVTSAAPENTMAAFARALDLGVDAVELDVRLTRDARPVLYHNYYLDDVTTGSGPLFERSAEELAGLRVNDRAGRTGARLPMLEDVLREFAGRLGLEIELKGPEPEAAAIVGEILRGFRTSWERIEVTSFEPALLTGLRAECEGITTALLFPLSEPWMRDDVVAYAALQRTRLARAQAVHLHPSQLTATVVATIRRGGIEIHAHSVNDEQSLELAVALTIPWICTDEPERALEFRRRKAATAS